MAAGLGKRERTEQEWDVSEVEECPGGEGTGEVNSMTGGEGVGEGR